MRSGLFVVSVVVALASRAAAQPSAGPAGQLAPSTNEPAPAEPAVRPPGLTAPVPAAPPQAPPHLSSSAPSIPTLAQPQPTSWTPPPPPRWRAEGVPIYGRQRGEVDENLAVALPLITTSLSWVAMIGGIESNNGSLGLAGALGTLMAPSIGHWYAGESSALGLGLRLGGAATLFVVALDTVSYEDSCDDDAPCSSHDDSKLVAALWVGVGLYVGGTLYDLATSGSAARDHNQRLRNLTLAPMVHGESRGLALTGRF